MKRLVLGYLVITALWISQIATANPLMGKQGARNFREMLSVLENITSAQDSSAATKLHQSLLPKFQAGSWDYRIANIHHQLRSTFNVLRDYSLPPQQRFHTAVNNMAQAIPAYIRYLAQANGLRQQLAIAIRLQAVIIRLSKVNALQVPYVTNQIVNLLYETRNRLNSAPWEPLIQQAHQLAQQSIQDAQNIYLNVHTKAQRLDQCSRGIRSAIQQSNIWKSVTGGGTNPGAPAGVFVVGRTGNIKDEYGTVHFRHNDPLVRRIRFKYLGSLDNDHVRYHQVRVEYMDGTFKYHTYNGVKVHPLQHRDLPLGGLKKVRRVSIRVTHEADRGGIEVIGIR